MATATATTYGILRAGIGERHYSLTRYEPAREIADFVERHWVVAWDLRGRAPFTQQLVPHPCVNLAFMNGAATVHGIPSARASRTIAGQGRVLGVKFRPGGFSPFTRIPMYELRDRVIAAEEVFGPEALDLARSVEAEEDVRARIALAEAFLRDRLPQPTAALELIGSVVSEMLAASGEVRVSDLAARHGLSVRALQRMFRRHVGVSPKWMLSRYRVHEAAERLAAGEYSNAALLAYDLGYFDQSHLNRAFRLLVGQTPAQYARSCALAGDAFDHD